MPARSSRRILIGLGVLVAMIVGSWLLFGDSRERPSGAEAVRGASSGDAPPGAASARAVALAEGPANAHEEEVWNPGGDEEPTEDDAQQWEWLQQDLDQLIDKTRPKARKRVGADEFREEYLKASIGYLELEGEELTRFETAARTSLKAVQDARFRLENAQEEIPYDGDDPDSISSWKAAQARFRVEQAEAAEQLAAALPRRPRTTMMREEAVRWVVRFDFGIRHSNRPASR